MAKNNTIVLQVKVDDKQLKKLGLTSKKVAKDVGDVGTSAHSADRQLKGAAKASSNTTKNFSKMAQGINGGLVPAYATFAASVFALGAVFRALSSAADLRILVEGQKAFGEATGKAMRSVAQATMLATESQISFREASQAAAIAGAAGFNADQIGRLGAAATNVSKVLGRDVTDSFNRLVRGTTKAEPELLDELGIILRLEVATQKYAAANNKLAKELTIFEKQQAVLNEVLGQAERKYAAVAASIKPNEFQQLLVSIEKITDKVGKWVGTILGPFATFLSENLYAAGAAVGLFALSIIRSVVPSYQQWIENTRLQNEAEREGLRLAQQRFALAKQAVFTKGTGGSARASLLTELTGGKEVAGTGQIAKFSRGEIAADAVSEKAIANFKSQMAQRKGFWKDADDSIVKSATETFHKLEVAQLKNMKTSERAAFTMKSAYELAMAGVNAAIGKTLVMFQTLVGATLKVASTVMRIAGIVGVVVTAISLAIESVKGIANFFKEDNLKIFNKKLAETVDFYKDLNEELTGIGKRLNMIQGEMSNTVELAVFLGNAFASISFKQLEDLLSMVSANEIVNYNKDLVESYNSLLNGLSAINPAFKEFFIIGNVTGAMAREQVKGMKQFAEFYTKAGAAVELLGSHEEKLQRIRAGNIKADSPLMREAAVLVDINDSLRISVGLTAERMNQLAPQTEDYAKLYHLIEEENKRIQENVERVKLLVDLEMQRTKYMTDQLAIATKLKIAGAFASKSKERELKIDQMMASLGQQQIELNQKQTALGDNATDAQKAEFAVMQSKLDLLNEEIVLQENLNNKRNEFIRTFQSSFQSELSGAFYNAIIGQETSLKDAMLNMVHGIGDALAKRISDQMAEQAIDALGETFGIFQDPAAEQMARIEALQEEINANTAEFLKAVNDAAQYGGETQKAVNKLITDLDTGFNKGAVTVKNAIIEGFNIATGKSIPGTPEFVGPPTPPTSMLPTIGSTPADKSVADDVLATGFNLASGTGVGIPGLPKSVNDALWKTLFNKSSWLQSIGGFFGMAKGGIMGYERGGVANDPTYIVGEGKNHEAVVPLPDNRSIPVKMNGNKGTNNVSVNVNMDGSTSTTATGEDAAAFGAAVSAAVQEEIQRQTRPGGILNRGKG